MSSNSNSDIKWNPGHSVAIIHVRCKGIVCVTIPDRNNFEIVHEDFIIPKNANILERRAVVKEVKMWVNYQNMKYNCSVNQWRTLEDVHEIEMKIESFERCRNGDAGTINFPSTWEGLKKYVWVSEVNKYFGKHSDVEFRIMAPKLRKLQQNEWMDCIITNQDRNYNGMRFDNGNINIFTRKNLDFSRISSIDKGSNNNNNSNSSSNDNNRRRMRPNGPNGLEYGLEVGTGKTGILHLKHDEKLHYYRVKRPLNGQKDERTFYYNPDLPPTDDWSQEIRFDDAKWYIIDPIEYQAYEETRVKRPGQHKTKIEKIDRFTDVSSIAAKLLLDPVILNARFEEHADPDYDLVLKQMFVCCGADVFEDARVLKNERERLLALKNERERLKRLQMEQNNNNSIEEMKESSQSVIGDEVDTSGGSESAMKD